MVLTAVQHEERRELNISVVMIPEPILTKVNITQIIAHLEQLDLHPGKEVCRICAKLTNIFQIF